MIFRSLTPVRVLAFVSLTISAFAAPKDKDYKYLALGDSVPFGLDIRLLPTGPGQPLPLPSQFRGYPEALAARVGIKHVNASCPGETSASFLNIQKPDNGCNGPGPQGQPPFKGSIGLHTAYTGAQMDFAVEELQDNKSIDLVTLSIGGNEILLILQQCASAANFGACVDGLLPGALKNYGANLGAILKGLRKHYHGALVVMKYYSPEPALNGIVGALNDVISQVDPKLKVQFADGFAAFQSASASYLNNPCKAGFVVSLGPACDVHPSWLGHNLLAGSVSFALWPGF